MTNDFLSECLSGRWMGSSRPARQAKRKILFQDVGPDARLIRSGDASGSSSAD